MLIYKVFFIILKIGFYLNVVGYKEELGVTANKIGKMFYLNVVGYKEVRQIWAEVLTW